MTSPQSASLVRLHQNVIVLAVIVKLKDVWHSLHQHGNIHAAYVRLGNGERDFVIGMPVQYGSPLSQVCKAYIEM